MFERLGAEAKAAAAAGGKVREGSRGILGIQGESRGIWGVQGDPEGWELGLGGQDPAGI